MTMVISDFSQRPKRAWQADGLADMAIGLVCLCLALMFLDGIYMVLFTQNVVIGSSRYWQVNRFNLVLTSALQLVVIVPFFLIEPLKRRFVYPRSGYMQLRAAPQDRRLAHALAAVALLTSLGFTFALTRATPHDLTRLSRFWTVDMTLIGISMGLGAALIVNYVRFGFVRHLVVAVIVGVAALGLTAVPSDWQHKMLVLSMVVGVSMLVAGAVPFTRLLRVPIASERDFEDATR